MKSKSISKIKSEFTSKEQIKNIEKSVLKNISIILRTTLDIVKLLEQKEKLLNEK